MLIILGEYLIDYFSKVFKKLSFIDYQYFHGGNNSILLSALNSFFNEALKNSVIQRG